MAAQQLEWAPEDNEDDETKREQLVEKFRQQQQMLLDGLGALEKDLTTGKAHLEKVCETLITVVASEFPGWYEDSAKAVAAAGEAGRDPEVQDDMRHVAAWQDGLEEVYLKAVNNAAVAGLREQAVRGVIEAVRNWEFRDDPENAELPDTEKLLKEALKQVPRELPTAELRKHPVAQRWFSEVAAEEGDEDVAAVNTGNDVPTRCQLLMQELEEPMRSKLCPHIFSKRGLKHYFKGGKRKSCPQGGCNKQLVFKDFEESEDLTYKVQRAIQLKRQREKRKRIDAVEDIGMATD